MLMACKLFNQKWSNFQEKKRVPPEHTANGNVHTGILLLGIIALERVI